MGQAVVEQSKEDACPSKNICCVHLIHNLPGGWKDFLTGMETTSPLTTAKFDLERSIECGLTLHQPLCFKNPVCSHLVRAASRLPWLCLLVSWPTCLAFGGKASSMTKFCGMQAGECIISSYKSCQNGL